MPDEAEAAIQRVKEAAERCTSRGVDKSNKRVWEAELLKELGIKKRICHACGGQSGSGKSANLDLVYTLPTDTA